MQRHETIYWWTGVCVCARQKDNQSFQRIRLSKGGGRGGYGILLNLAWLLNTQVRSCARMCAILLFRFITRSLNINYFNTTVICVGHFDTWLNSMAARSPQFLLTSLTVFMPLCQSVSLPWLGLLSGTQVWLVGFNHRYEQRCRNEVWLFFFLYCLFVFAEASCIILYLCCTETQIVLLHSQLPPREVTWSQ